MKFANGAAWIQGEAEKELAEFYPKDSTDARRRLHIYGHAQFDARVQAAAPNCRSSVPFGSPRNPIVR